MLSQFAQDTKAGLSAFPKYLSSKYFYDDEGSRIFQDIMNLEEYYPTDCEYEIFETHQEALLSQFQSKGKPFQIVEFGAGDGLKTKILLNHCLEKKADIQYLPIDISQEAVKGLLDSLQKEMPHLKVKGFINEYFEALKLLKGDTTTRKVVFFLGGNIGNFNHEQALGFLKNIRENLNEGDLLLIGMDLMKNPRTIIAAYDDSKGVTRDFNLNLLCRMNAELGANFNIQKFQHYPTYNPITGETKSYLISKEKQEVYFEELDQSFQFEAWEAIHTENSQKYSLKQIQEMAAQAGFQFLQNYLDKREYFADSLWEAR